jgi:hypothetical protein
MSSFTKPLILIAPNDLGEWSLYEEFSYYDSKGTIYNIPKGFKTDFASVPRLFWNLFPPYGRYGKAAVLHDYLYSYKILPKHEADLEFYEAMKVLEVDKITIKILYLSVKYFGYSAYYRRYSG